MRTCLLVALSTVSWCVVGCKTWHPSPVGSSWESGVRSVAGWRTSAGIESLDRITVVERTATVQPNYDADYIMTAYNAVSSLLATARPAIDGNDAFDRTRPVIYATTVDLNNYSTTSNFGRLMGEALATALTQHWRNKVVKMTLRQGSVPIVPNQGEFLLSREVQDLATDYHAGAVLVSSYSVALDKVYVAVELINVDFNSVVASTMFEIPLGPRTVALLNNQQFPSPLSPSAVSYVTKTQSRYPGARQ